MVTEFQMRVYDLTSKIPKGKVSTYGDLAKKLNISSAQAVGQALRRNPYAPKVPCHRVVASDGSIGGFGGCMSGRHIREKIALLKKEGVKVAGGRVLDFEKVRLL